MGFFFVFFVDWFVNPFELQYMFVVYSHPIFYQRKRLFYISKTKFNIKLEFQGSLYVITFWKTKTKKFIHIPPGAE